MSSEYERRRAKSEEAETPSDLCFPPKGFNRFDAADKPQVTSHFIHTLLNQTLGPPGRRRGVTHQRGGVNKLGGKKAKALQRKGGGGESGPATCRKHGGRRETASTTDDPRPRRLMRLTWAGSDQPDWLCADSHRIYYNTAMRLLRVLMVSGERRHRPEAGSPLRHRLWQAAFSSDVPTEPGLDLPPRDARISADEAPPPVPPPP